MSIYDFSTLEEAKDFVIRNFDWRTKQDLQYLCDEYIIEDDGHFKVLLT